MLKTTAPNAGQKRFYVAGHQHVPDLHINLTCRRYYKFLIIDNVKESSPGLHPNFSQEVSLLAVF